MLDSESISKELKDRANRIIRQKEENDAARVKFATVIGIIVMLSGLFAAMAEFEDLWYLLVTGIALGAIIIALGSRTEAGIPEQALKLYAYGEIIDRLEPTADGKPAADNHQPTNSVPARKKVETEANGAAPTTTTAVPIYTAQDKKITQSVPVSTPAPKKEVVAPAQSTMHSWRCGNCGQMISKFPCEHCGYNARKSDAPYWCGICGHSGPYEGNCPTCNSSIKVFNVSKKK